MNLFLASIVDRPVYMSLLVTYVIFLLWVFFGGIHLIKRLGDKTRVSPWWEWVLGGAVLGLVYMTCPHIELFDRRSTRYSLVGYRVYLVTLLGSIFVLPSVLLVYFV